MITGIKAYPLLAGLRGKESYYIDALVDVILKASKLASDFVEIEKFEINPLIVFKEEIDVLEVDIRLKLRSEIERFTLVTSRKARS